jgi:hypothetical protein
MKTNTENKSRWREPVDAPGFGSDEVALELP